jgi:hypothetical protein
LEEGDDIVMFDEPEEEQGAQAGAFSVEERGSGETAADAQGASSDKVIVRSADDK